MLFLLFYGILDEVMISKNKKDNKPRHVIKRLLVYNQEYLYGYQGMYIGKSSNPNISSAIAELLDDIFEDEELRPVHIKMDQVTIDQKHFNKDDYDDIPLPVRDLEEGTWERWKEIERRVNNK